MHNVLHAPTIAAPSVARKRQTLCHILVESSETPEPVVTRSLIPDFGKLLLLLDRQAPMSDLSDTQNQVQSFKLGLPYASCLPQPLRVHRCR